MKKILLFTLIFTVFISTFIPSVWAYSDEMPILVEDPDPFGLGLENEKDDPYAELSEVECLHRGLIRVWDGMNHRDLYNYMQIVDNSDGKYNTAKLFYLFEMILTTYYGSFTADSLVTAFLQEFDYIDTNDMETVYKTLFSVLDKYSYYLNPDEAKAFFYPNDTRAVGILTKWQEKDASHLVAGMYVDAVAPFSAADEAGIAVGDRLLVINGIDVSGLGFNAVSTILTEESRDRDFMEYTFERYGENAGVYEYVLERREVTFSEYKAELYPETGTLFIDLDSFMNASTAYELSDVIDYAWGEGYRKVVLDLENNSGGNVDIAAAIASKFVSTPLQVLFYIGREDNRRQYPYFSMGNGYDFESVTVIVNSASISSAEILTDTLRKTAGAKVVGSTTYGKGVAQMATQFNDGSAVGITAYVAYDTEGETYNEKGIVPDRSILPKVKKNELSINTESLTYGNFSNAVMGEDNFAVRALEKRLLVLDYLAPSATDGLFDESTALALKTLQTDYGLEKTGTLDEPTLDLVLTLISEWENSYTVVETVPQQVLK